MKVRDLIEALKSFGMYADVYVANYGADDGTYEYEPTGITEHTGLDGERDGNVVFTL